MVSTAIQYFNVNVLTLLCYIGYINLHHMFSFAFESKLSSMFCLDIYFFLVTEMANFSK